jgi:hypothetical protein
MSVFSEPNRDSHTVGQPNSSLVDPLASSANLGRGGLALLIIGALVVFLGPSLVLEICYGNRATVFNNAPSSRPEINAYYQSYRGMCAGRMPWRDPQLADHADRLLPPSMAVPQIIGTLFTAPFEERIHWGGNLAVFCAVILLIYLLAILLRNLTPGQPALQFLAIALIVFGGQEFYGTGALAQGISKYLAVLTQSRNFLYLNRLSSPALTLPFFVLAIELVGRALSTERRRDFVWAGLAAGLLAYSYIYHWMAVMAMLGVLVLTELYAGRRALALKLIGALSLATLVSAPCVAICVIVGRTQYGMDVLLRRGVTIGRAPELCSAVAILAVLLVGTKLIVRPSRERTQLMALLAGLWMTRWSNVVLGKDIATDHIQWHAMIPLLPIVGIYFVYSLITRPTAMRWRVSRWVPALAYALAFLAFLHGVCFQIGSLRRYWPDFQRPAAAVAMQQYIRDKLPRGVVAADSWNETLRLAVGSRCFPYLTHSSFPPITMDELEERLRIHGEIFDLSNKDVVTSYGSVFCLHLTPEPQNAELLRKFAAETENDPPPAPTKYQIDYLVANKPLKAVPGTTLTLLHQIEDLRLYKLEPAPPTTESVLPEGH